ncbi:MAG: hypothetical protein NWF06_05470 [Candidatus Bathyarchaeota archaeon]|nr:hypothetical protein [Candidatus Bathyarchaeum sp.]
MANVGLKIKYGVELKEGKNKGNFSTVGDKEHMQIISLYAEGNSYAVISDQLSRSTKTISDHMRKHNNSVKRSVLCPVCRRAGDEFWGKEVFK